MSCLGVHFALSASEVAVLKSLPNENDRLRYLQEVIEEDYFANHTSLIAQCDKSWDAMHRILSDGGLTWGGGEYPLSHVVLGGERLYTQTDYIMSLKTPQQVIDIAKATSIITRDEFRNRYLRIDRTDYGMELCDEDFDYTWDGFHAVRELFQQASRNGRFVLFTADQ